MFEVRQTGNRVGQAKSQADLLINLGRALSGFSAEARDDLMEKARIDMSLFEASYWTLRVDPLPTVPLVPEEPEHFIRETSGRIVCSHFDKDKDQIAGRFRVYYADFELEENHQMSAREVLDAYQHTFEYADVILDRNERPFSPRLYKLLDDDIWNFNFLILDRLEILPKYRGHGAGLLLLRSLIERFGSGAGVVGMKPFPLQSEAKQLNDSSWAKRLQLEKLSSDHDASQRKLKLYYRKLGFQEMRGTPFMFWSASWRLPSVQDLQSSGIS